MPGEPRNAASERSRADVSRYGDPEFVRTGVRALLADDFVREDRRALIALPTVGVDGWIDQLLSFFELGGGDLTMEVGRASPEHHDRWSSERVRSRAAVPSAGGRDGAPRGAS